MLVYFYFDFAKKLNSTKVIDANVNDFVAMNVSLKASENIEKPSLEISGVTVEGSGTGHKLWEANYCFIPDFNRFYYIDTWQYNVSTWVCFLHEDVLASWRDQILQQDLYVKRGPEQVADGHLIDNTMIVTGDQPLIMYSDKNNPLVAEITATSQPGVFVVGVVGKATDFGAVSYYAMDFDNFRSFMQSLYNNVDWLDIDDVSANMQKALVNPMQYIKSCIYYPIDYHSLSTAVHTSVPVINIGYWSITVGAKLVNHDVPYYNLSYLDIPRPDWYGDSDKYLTLAPYATYTLKYLPFGVFQIDSTEIVDSSRLMLYTLIDLTNGHATLQLSTSQTNYSRSYFRVIQGNVGISVPLASFSLQTPTTVGGLLSTGIQAAAAYLPSPAQKILGGVREGFNTFMSTGSLRESFHAALDYGAKDLGETVNSALGSALGKVESSGGSGSIQDYYQLLSLVAEYKYVRDPALRSTIGYPCMRQMKLNTITYGFCQADTTNLYIYGATFSELSAIKNFIEGGIMLE